MYEAHWKLERRPFDARADERSYYPSESHQAAALKLTYAMEQRRSVAVLCGDSGLGKSMILDSCLSQLPVPFAPVARVVYPAMPPEQLIQHIVRQVGPHEKGAIPDLSLSIEILDRALRRNVAEGMHAIIAIDEAHLLSQFGSMESLRLLLNLAADSCPYESPITLVLCGSTSIISQMAKNPSLEDRIAVRCVLERFSFDDTVAYIQHRLRAAGGKSERVFSEDALNSIQMNAMGIPRRINRLCDLALMIGFAQDLKQIDAPIIESANLELSSVRRAAS